MTKTSAFRATVECEIILNYNCPSRSSIFFSAAFIEITVLYSKANREMESHWQTSARLQNRRRFVYDLRFLCRLVWLKLLSITHQIHEKHFVRNQEYWNEDWNKSSNGEWTLQGINMGVLLSIWRREFLGIPFRNIFIIYVNFKPCPWRLFTTTSRTVFFFCRSFIPVSFYLSPF